MSEIRTGPSYKLKLTKKEQAERWRSLKATSPLYKEIKRRGVSNKKLRQVLGVRLHYIYEVFSDPMSKLTLKRIMAIYELLDRDYSVSEIITMTMPEADRHWYELKDWEESELMKRLTKNA